MKGEYSWACTEMQGWRPTMEDVVMVEEVDRSARPALKTHKIALFGIFDGHCGRDVSDFAAKNFPRIFEEQFNLLEKSEGIQLRCEKASRGNIGS